jgi:hypothetical protein
MADRAVAKHRQRWFRMSVRGLIVSVLVIGGLLAWFVHRVRMQSHAVAAIRKAGGLVWYEWDRSGRFHDLREPRSPRWLLDLIGINCLYNVEGAYLGGRSNDVVLAEVANLTRLRFLAIDSLRKADSVTDNGMRHVERLAALESLTISASIGDMQVTDTGLVHLQRLIHLKTLQLAGTKITNAGLVHLRNLPNLEELSLVNTRVGDGSMCVLKEMASLKRLDLSFTLCSFSASAELHRALPGTWIDNHPLRWGPGAPDDGTLNPAR